MDLASRLIDMPFAGNFKVSQSDQYFVAVNLFNNTSYDIDITYNNDIDSSSLL